LTIIFTLGDAFWIESHQIARATLADAANRNMIVPVDKAGVLLGLSATPDADGTAHLTSEIRLGDNAFITFGVYIDSVIAASANGLEYNITNNSGGSLEVGAHILIFKKQRGL